MPSLMIAFMDSLDQKRGIQFWSPIRLSAKQRTWVVFGITPVYSDSIVQTKEYSLYKHRKRQYEQKQYCRKLADFYMDFRLLAWKPPVKEKYIDMYWKGMFYIIRANNDVKKGLLYDLIKVYESKWRYDVYMRNNHFTCSQNNIKINDYTKSKVKN